MEIKHFLVLHLYTFVYNFIVIVKCIVHLIYLYIFTTCDNFYYLVLFSLKFKMLCLNSYVCCKYCMKPDVVKPILIKLR